MKKNLIKIIFILLLTPIFVFGDKKGLIPCSGIDCELCHIFELLSNLISFLLISIVPPVAALLFVFGGVKMLTAGGDAGKVNDAKKLMTNVVIGLVIVYSAHLLISGLLKVLGADVSWPDIGFC